MDKSLRLLLVEDSEDDAKLLELQLKRREFEVQCRRASTEQALIEALHEPWDLVIVDYFIPGFDVSEALNIIKERVPVLPIIVVSGQTHEDRAVAVMRAGAQDYINKANFVALASAVERELQEAQDRRRARHAEMALRQSEEQYRLLFQAHVYPMWVFDPETVKMVAVNEAALQLYGYTEAEFMALPLIELSAYGENPFVSRRRAVAAVVSNNITVRHRKKDGQLLWVELTMSPVVFNRCPAVLVLSSDITARKQAEDQLADNRARLQELSRRLFDVREDERRHIARDLHDEIGQNLTAVKLDLHSMQQFPDPARVQKCLAANIAILERVINQVRALLSDLRPVLLPELGLIAALREYLNQQSQRAGLQSEFVASGPIGRFDEMAELACFRVAQEAVSNVIRHARATKVEVHLELIAEDLVLTVADDGIGFDPRLVPGAEDWHFGWTGMQERAALIGGAVECLPTPHRGTRLQARFPVKRLTHGYAHPLS